MSLGALAAPLTVQVFDRTSGLPLSDVRVSIDMLDSDTDDAGVAQFDEQGDNRGLSISHPEYLRFDQRLSSSPRKTPLRIGLTRNRDFNRDVTLRGHALTEDGGVLGGRVDATCGVTDRQVYVGDGGSFELAHLAPGPCRVTFSGQWSGVSALQFIALGARSPPIEIGPRAGSANVSVRVPGATAHTRVQIVAGSVAKPPRHCELTCNCTGGISAIWDYPGAECPIDGGRYRCVGVPRGRYTVIAFANFTGNSIHATFDEWSQELEVGTKDVSISMPPWVPPAPSVPPWPAAEPADSGYVMVPISGLRGPGSTCEWP